MIHLSICSLPIKSSSAGTFLGSSRAVDATTALLRWFSDPHNLPRAQKYFEEVDVRQEVDNDGRDVFVVTVLETIPFFFGMYNRRTIFPLKWRIPVIDPDPDDMVNIHVFVPFFIRDFHRKFYIEVLDDSVLVRTIVDITLPWYLSWLLERITESITINVHQEFVDCIAEEIGKEL
ncbi:hypothetical protein HDU83_006644 [Entophlyctis luteolus]|nr:hypothetical protein HDU83_006644 [Entophlyctis luteolus]